MGVNPEQQLSLCTPCHVHHSISCVILSVTAGPTAVIAAAEGKSCWATVSRHRTAMELPKMDRDLNGAVSQARKCVHAATYSIS